MTDNDAPTAGPNLHVNFDAPATLRKWPSRSNERLAAPCVYRKLKPGRSDGEARRGWGVNESFRSDESDEKSAHPYAKTDAF